MVRNATVATAAPGPRASPMAASRAGSPRLPRSALNRASAGKIRATDECCGDRDEAGEHEQEERRPLAARELLFVSGAADERHSDDEHRSRGNEVECSDPRALALRERHGDKDENGCDDGGRGRDAEPDRRQDALAQHVDDGRSGEPATTPATAIPAIQPSTTPATATALALDASRAATAATSAHRTR